MIGVGFTIMIRISLWECLRDGTSYDGEVLINPYQLVGGILCMGIPLMGCSDGIGLGSW